MKKIYLTLYTLIIAIPFAIGQIPNGGFELWNAAGNDITSWESTNGLTQLGNPQTIYRSANAYTGSYACEINTKKITAKPPGVFIPDYSGSMFVGKQISVRSIPGFPYTERPEKFTFWYQYNARNNDSATSLIMLTKWNTPLNKRDTIAIAFNLITDSVGIYTKNEVLLNYLDTSERPDTAIIYFSAATNHASKEGAKFLLDELNLVGGTVGIQENILGAGLVVYPNPSSNGLLYISVRTEIKMEQVNIYNISGSKVWQLDNLSANELQINTQLPKGLYLLELRHSKGFETKKIVVE